jgi:hypothetical protein
VYLSPRSSSRVILQVTLVGSCQPVLQGKFGLSQESRMSYTHALQSPWSESCRPDRLLVPGSSRVVGVVRFLGQA